MLEIRLFVQHSGQITCSRSIVKKRLKSQVSLYTILQILSLTLFEKILLIQLLTEVPFASEEIDIANQLNLFEFLPDSSAPTYESRRHPCQS